MSAAALVWITTIATILVAVATEIWSVRRSHRNARELARQTGGLRRPVIGLQMFDGGIGNPEGEEHIWTFVLPHTKAVGAWFFLPMHILNVGDGPTGDLIVTIKAPGGLFADDEDIVASVSPAVVQGWRRACEHGVEDGAKFDLASYAVPSIAPGTSAMLRDFIFLMPSFDRQKKFSVKSADGKPLKVQLGYSFTYRVLFEVRFRDEPPIAVSMTFMCVRAKNAEAAAQLIRDHEKDIIDGKRAAVNSARRPSLRYYHVIEFSVAERWMAGKKLIIGMDTETETVNVLTFAIGEKPPKPGIEVRK